MPIKICFGGFIEVIIMHQKLSVFIIMLMITAIFPVAQTIEIESNDSKDWTIVETFSIPESASGLAFDGTYLYCGIYGSNGNNIYQIDPSDGSYSLLCEGPQEDAYGLTYDGSYLWTTDHPGSSSDPAIALQFSMNGSEMSQFDLPDHYMSGITYDDGDFWVSTYYDPDGWIYNVDDTGSILHDFAAPDTQPWDLCVENNYLWMVDIWGDAIYKIDLSDGSLLESYDSEGTEPSGIVWDGSYLWYCDNGQDGVDYLYKVDLAGSGTPEINVPITNHDYGIVTIGNQVTWDVTIESVGSSDLIIDDIAFTGTGSEYLSCSETFPVTIPNGDSDQLQIVYEPLSPGSIDAIATIHCNDPVDPEVDLTLTGDAVSPGPDIYLPEDTHDFGSIRLNAYIPWEMEIKNMGDSTLTVTDISSSNTHFIIDPDVSFPFDLDTFESKIVNVWFEPTEETTYTTPVSIISNDPGESPYDVFVEGAGIAVSYPIGDAIWDYQITEGYDNSPKAILSLPDINYDGINEVIVCSEDDYIRCFNGNDYYGSVLWEKEIYSGSLFHQQEIQLTEDIDGDGFNDFIVGTPWGDRSILTISGKTGETIWKHDTHEYGGGGWVYMVDCSKDYNDDGMEDVLAATGDDADDTGPKRVYCLDAYDGDSIWECYIGGPVFSVIGVDDFTGDGKPDTVAGASNNAETEGKVYGINGASGEIEWTFTATGSSVWALAQIDDCTTDGIQDVIIGDYYAYGDVYGLDATSGDEIFNSNINAELILRFEQIGDVNDDGHPDILPSHSGDTAKIIDGYTGDIIWSTSLADKSWCVANAQDITGDEINDVFIGTTYTNNYCYFINGANGTIINSESMKGPVDALAATQDIIGDGSMELVAGIRDGTVLTISGGEVELPPQPPTADFTIEPTNPIANQIVYFNSTSSDSDGYIVNWTWDMGDGIMLYGDQVTHSYAVNGSYEVILTVTDNNATTDLESKTIGVGEFEYLDVEQTMQDRGFPIRHATDGDWAGAQNFTPTLSHVSKVELYLRSFGTPGFDLTVELRLDGPEGTLLDTATFTPGEIPSSWTWLEVDFEDQDVDIGSDVFIVVPPAPSGVTTSFGYEWGYAFGDQYDDGSFWFTRDGGGLWRDLPDSYEFTFKTFGFD